MTVAELIEALKQMPQDAQVYSYTDHGQTFEKSQFPTVAYAEEAVYSFEYTYSLDEAEECGIDNPVTVVVL